MKVKIYNEAKLITPNTIEIKTAYAPGWIHSKNQTRSDYGTEAASLGLHCFSPEAHKHTEAGIIAAA